VKIALDATYSIGDELSGVGIYSRALLFGLAEAHPDVGFDFCYRPHRFWRAGAEVLPRNARRRLLAGPLGARSADLFHGLNQRLPRVHMRRSAATFHDLFVLSGEYSTPEFRARFAAQARDAAARTDLVITVSEFTKSQVTGLLGVPAGKVRVVHHGVRKLVLPPMARENVILHVGAIQKRKNLARLVEAFAAVDGDWRLVLAGSAGYGAAEIEAGIQASPARDRIQVTGYVSNHELARWYARASIFAFPSLDEGFGMPVLEAMAAGIPVLAANSSSLPEVAGTAAILVDPGQTDAIADGLRRLTQDAALRRELARQGHERANLFSWDHAVHGTWGVYKELLR
jgi:glycosyltransferase involved in cell wall biosynthesis